MKYLYIILFVFLGNIVNAQLNATFTTTLNNICNGSGCDYDGPSILINEMMMSPSTGDGSLAGDDANQRGEWIELYNPNVCEPVDISCYYLGSNFGDANTNSETYVLPQGTIVPPTGFCVVRGVNAPAVPAEKLVENGGNTVEIVMPATVSGDNICVEGGFLPVNIRFWFPNAGGWFAFYDRDGVPQDAVMWSTPASTSSAVTCIPTPSDCDNLPISQLASYNDIPADRKTNVYSSGAIPNSWGRSSRRVPDGGDWVLNQGDPNPTMGDCNDVCAEQGTSSCDGTATINVTGGSGNYTYLWNDSEAQLTQTAVGLCEGEYEVTVTDNSNGTSQTFTVNIENIEISSSSTSTPSTCGNTDGSITITGAEGASPYTYSVGEGTPQTEGTFSDLGSGSYDYVVMDANGCVSTGTQSINDVGGVEIAAVNGTDPSCYNICDGTVSVQAEGGTEPYTYIWTDAQDSIVGTTPSLTDLCGGLYSISVVDANGCSAAGQTTLTTPEELDPSFELTDHCAGEENYAINIGSDGGTFSIVSPTNDGATIDEETGEISGGVSGTTYTVSYETADGCSSSTETVFILAAPDVDLNATPLSGEPPLEVEFTNGTGPDNDYSWNFGDGNFLNDNGEVITHTYEGVGIFDVVLTATNSLGCTSSGTVQISIAYPDMEYVFPNVFTPNGDNNNDGFRFTYEDHVAYIEIIILNRWGILVYEFEGENMEEFVWNGKVKNTGAMCEDGVYFYKATLTNLSGNKAEEHGFVHLVGGK